MPADTSEKETPPSPVPRHGAQLCAESVAFHEGKDPSIRHQASGQARVSDTPVAVDGPHADPVRGCLLAGGPRAHVQPEDSSRGTSGKLSRVGYPSADSVGDRLTPPHTPGSEMKSFNFGWAEQKHGNGYMDDSIEIKCGANACTPESSRSPRTKQTNRRFTYTSVNARRGTGSPPKPLSPRKFEAYPCDLQFINEPKMTDTQKPKVQNTADVIKKSRDSKKTTGVLEGELVLPSDREAEDSEHTQENATQSHSQEKEGKSEVPNLNKSEIPSSMDSAAQSQPLMYSPSHRLQRLWDVNPDDTPPYGDGEEDVVRRSPRRHSQEDNRYADHPRLQCAQHQSRWQLCSLHCEDSAEDTDCLSNGSDVESCDSSLLSCSFRSDYSDEDAHCQRGERDACDTSGSVFVHSGCSDRICSEEQWTHVTSFENLDADQPMDPRRAANAAANDSVFLPSRGSRTSSCTGSDVLEDSVFLPDEGNEPRPSPEEARLGWPPMPRRVSARRKLSRLRVGNFSLASFSNEQARKVLDRQFRMAAELNRLRYGFNLYHAGRCHHPGPRLDSLVDEQSMGSGASSVDVSSQSPADPGDFNANRFLPFDGHYRRGYDIFSPALSSQSSDNLSGISPGYVHSYLDRNLITGIESIALESKCLSDLSHAFGREGEDLPNHRSSSDTTPPSSCSRYASSYSSGSLSQSDTEPLPNTHMAKSGCVSGHNAADGLGSNVKERGVQAQHNSTFTVHPSHDNSVGIARNAATILGDCDSCSAADTCHSRTDHDENRTDHDENRTDHDEDNVTDHDENRTDHDEDNVTDHDENRTDHDNRTGHDENSRTDHDGNSLTDHGQDITRCCNLFRALKKLDADLPDVHREKTARCTAPDTASTEPHQDTATVWDGASEARGHNDHNKHFESWCLLKEDPFLRIKENQHAFHEDGLNDCSGRVRFCRGSTLQLMQKSQSCDQVLVNDPFCAFSSEDTYPFHEHRWREDSSCLKMGPYRPEVVMQQLESSERQPEEQERLCEDSHTQHKDESREERSSSPDVGHRTPGDLRQQWESRDHPPEEQTIPGTREEQRGGSEGISDTCCFSRCSFEDLTQQSESYGCPLEKDDCPPEKDDHPLEKDDFPLEKDDYPPEKDDYPLEKDDCTPEEKDDYPLEKGDCTPEEKDDCPLEKDDCPLEKGDCTREEKDDYPLEKDDCTPEEKDDYPLEKDDCPPEKDHCTLKKDDCPPEKDDCPPENNPGEDGAIEDWGRCLPLGQCSPRERRLRFHFNSHLYNLLGCEDWFRVSEGNGDVTDDVTGLTRTSESVDLTDAQGPGSSQNDERCKNQQNDYQHEQDASFHNRADPDCGGTSPKNGDLQTTRASTQSPMVLKNRTLGAPSSRSRGETIDRSRKSGGCCPSRRKRGRGHRRRPRVSGQQVRSGKAKPADSRTASDLARGGRVETTPWVTADLLHHHDKDKDGEEPCGWCDSVHGDACGCWGCCHLHRLLGVCLVCLVCPSLALPVLLTSEGRGCWVWISFALVLLLLLLLLLRRVLVLP